MEKLIKKLLLSKLCLAFLVLTFGLPVWAGSVYYVKTGGNDNLDGLSDETAWASIAKVEATVRSGDTVYFRSQDTWSAASDQVLNATTAGVTFDGSTYGTEDRATFQATGMLAAVVKLSASNLTFQGFDIDMNNQITGGIYVGTYSASDVSTLVVDDCKVHDSDLGEGVYRYGIHVGGYINTNVDVDGVTITDTEVYDTGHEAFAIYPTWTREGCTAKNVTMSNCIGRGAGINGDDWGDGLYLVNRVENATIENCSFYDNDRGVTISTSTNYTGTPTGIVFRYNLIRDNQDVGLSMHPSNNGYGITGTIDIYSNIIYGNTGSGIWIAGKWNTSTVSIYNNTVATTGNYFALYVYGVSGTGTPFYLKNNILIADDYRIMKFNTSADLALISHSNNLVYRFTGANQWYILDNLNYTQANVIDTWEATAQNTGPLFADASGGDFRITSGSDAIDKGADLSAYFTMDYYGNPRPHGTGFDIGAHEYQGADNTSPSAPANLQVVAP